MVASFPYFLTREKYLQAFEEFENKNNITFFFITPAVNKKDKLLYLGKRLLVDIQSLESPDQLVKILGNIKSEENERAIDLLKIVSQEFKDFIILFTFLLNSIYSKIFFIPLYMEDIIKITNVLKSTKEGQRLLKEFGIYNNSMQNVDLKGRRIAYMLYIFVTKFFHYSVSVYFR